MANVPDSSQVGYLLPAAGPPYDKDLEDVFQQIIAGCTGLPGELVRPRYQQDPPNRPSADVDWCAFSVKLEGEDWQAYRTLDAANDYVVERTEVIHVGASFYGPNCTRTERLWRDGVQVGQNLDALLGLDQPIQLVEFADPVVLPALLKDVWQKRADAKATFHRWSSRRYPVLSFASADITIKLDDGRVIQVAVTNP